MRPPKPHNRAGVWYLVRRVPKRYQHLDARSLVYITTGIHVVDDPRGGRAANVVAQLNEVLEQGWRELADGREPNQEQRYERARRAASNLGIRYVEGFDLVHASAAEIRRRIDVLSNDTLASMPGVLEAVTGVVPPPPLLLSGLVKAFEREQAAALKAMSPDQLRRWRNPKTRAAQDLIELIGDKAVTALTRADALAFRDHWKDKVLAGKA